MLIIYFLICFFVWFFLIDLNNVEISFGYELIFFNLFVLLNNLFINKFNVFFVLFDLSIDLKKFLVFCLVKFFDDNNLVRLKLLMNLFIKVLLFEVFLVIFFKFLFKIL